MASQLLHRTMSVPGHASGPEMQGMHSMDQPGGSAVEAKHTEHALQRVFDSRQSAQNALPSLPDIMRWGQDLLEASQQVLTPECSESSGGSLRRCATDPARKPPSPATSQSGGVDSPARSSLVSASAIQKCLMAAPPCQRKFPTSSSVTSTTSAFSPLGGTPASASTQHTPAGSSSSSPAIARCPSVAPRRANGQGQQGVAPGTGPQQGGACQVHALAEAEGLKAVASWDSIVSLCPAGGPEGDQAKTEVHIAADDFFLDQPEPEAVKKPAFVSSNGASCGRPSEEEVEKLAAACMDTLNKLMNTAAKPPSHPSRASEPKPLASRGRPTPLLVDGEALGGFCPEALADICGALTKSPNNTDANAFQWDGALPTPNAGATGGEDALWADAWDEGAKGGLVSPGGSRPDLWFQ